MRFLVRLLKAVLLTGGVAVGLLTVLWLASFADPAPPQDDCAFGSVTKDEYEQLLRRAKAQNWTVWPSLSNGIFWPSDRGLRPPTAALEPATGEKLLGFTRQLVSESASANTQLAAAHALMRSIGAELVYVFDVPDYHGHSRIRFTYFLPQRRFAPLCLFCFLWPFTTVSVVFKRDIAVGTIALDQVVILHAGLKYDSTKEPNIPGPCPAFPSASKGR